MLNVILSRGETPIMGLEEAEALFIDFRSPDYMIVAATTCRGV